MAVMIQRYFDDDMDALEPDRVSLQIDIHVAEILDPSLKNTGIRVFPARNGMYPDEGGQPGEFPDVFDDCGSTDGNSFYITYNYYEFIRDPDHLYRLYWMIMDFALKKGSRAITFPIFGNRIYSGKYYVEMCRCIRSFREAEKLGIYISESEFEYDYSSAGALIESMKKYPDIDDYDRTRYAEELKKETYVRQLSFPGYLKYLIDKKIEEDRNTTDTEGRKITKDSDVYKGANVNRSVFNKIINSEYKGESYRPKKKTVLSLIIGAHLDIYEAQKLLQKAEFSFLPGNETDELVKDFIINRNYNIEDINEVLKSRNLERLSEYYENEKR